MTSIYFCQREEAGLEYGMKSVNQLLAGIHILAMAEALTLRTRQGIDAARIVEVI